MASLIADTELEDASDSEWHATLSRAWEIWGPNGGYMAAFALRAAAIHSGRARPANATVHFLGVAEFDAPITVRARTLRAARQATSIAVDIEQSATRGDTTTTRPILSALVWALDDGLDGLVHDDEPAPDAAHWTDLPTIEERKLASGVTNAFTYPFWDNFDQRPPEWIDDWENRTVGPARYENWLRFVDDAVPTDSWQQACRLLLLVDLGAWPSIGRRHTSTEWIAPSLDVSCEFHRPSTADEWFFLRGESTFGGDGLLASHQRVWNDRGELLASGVSHLLCRRVPNTP